MEVCLSMWACDHDELATCSGCHPPFALWQLGEALAGPCNPECRTKLVLIMAGWRRAPDQQDWGGKRGFDAFQSEPPAYWLHKWNKLCTFMSLLFSAPKKDILCASTSFVISCTSDTIPVMGLDVQVLSTFGTCPPPPWFRAGYSVLTFRRPSHRSGNKRLLCWVKDNHCQHCLQLMSLTHSHNICPSPLQITLTSS